MITEDYRLFLKARIVHFKRERFIWYVNYITIKLLSK